MPNPFPEEATPPAKYWDERNDSRHPGQLSWPGVGGLPVLGTQTLLLHPHERDRMQVVRYKHVKTFDLSLPEDHVYYVWVRDHAVSGLFAIDYESYHPLECTDDAGHKFIKMIVHLEWSQCYAVMPNHPKGATTNVDATNYVLR